MNTKWKIILLVMMIILSICGVFISLFISESRKSLETFVLNEVNSMRAIIKTLEEEDSRNYRNRIQSFVNYVDFPKREQLINAFAERDRDKLLKLSTPYLTIFKNENSQFRTFTWLTPKNKIFLRVHNPTLFGDDISEKRPDIVNANQNHLQFAAYKISGPGLLYSILQPVTYKGQHLGILQFGLKENLLLDNLYKNLGHPIGIAIPNKGFSYINSSEIQYFTGSSHSFQSKQLELFQEGAEKIDWMLDQQKVSLKGSSYIVANVFNLLNFKKETEGSIFVALDISAQEDRLQSHINLILLISAFLLLLSFSVLYSSYGILLKQIFTLNTILEKNNLELEQNITKRTIELAEEKERLQAITENVPGVVFQFYANNNGDTGVHYVSPKLSEIFELEFIDNPSLFLQAFVKNIHQEDQQSWIDSFQEAVTKQIQWKWKGRYIKPTGKTIWFEGQSTPTVRKNEIVFDGIFIDITKKREREIQRLETLQEKEQIKNFESLKTMAGAIAHRFNNAMMAVTGNLELIIQSLPDESPVQKMAHNASLAANGASQVGTMMLSYVGQDTLECQELSLPNVVQETINTFESNFLPHISLKFIQPEEALYCSLDPHQINKVVESILLNGVESLKDEPGTIKITFGTQFFTTDSFPIIFQNDTLHDGMYSFCQIKDTGHGINPENLSRIFEPFYTTRFVGRGLGLALTVGVMRSHHGAITVESVQDKGTTVRILFPAISKS